MESRGRAGRKETVTHAATGMKPEDLKGVGHKNKQTNIPYDSTYMRCLEQSNS